MKLFETKKFWTGAAAAAVLFGATLSAPQTAYAAPVEVDLELSLLVDVSGSISTGEFNLQRSGYANAFASQAIKDLITELDGGNRLGSIAVNMVQWSSAGLQDEVIGWTQISSDADADAFSASIAGTGRSFGGSTAPGSALNFGAPLFATNNFEGRNKVIDISGDGVQNNGASTTAARDAALAAGIDRINGIVIGGGNSVLNFYTNSVIGGTAAFVLQAGSFADFQGVMEQKLAFELTGTSPNPIPLPAPFLLLIGGIAGLGVVSRKRKAA